MHRHVICLKARGIAKTNPYQHPLLIDAVDAKGEISSIANAKYNFVAGMHNIPEAADIVKAMSGNNGRKRARTVAVVPAAHVINKLLPRIHEEVPAERRSTYGRDGERKWRPHELCQRPGA